MDNASPQLTSVSFVVNCAQNRGAVYNSGSYGSSSPTFINAAFTDNSATDTGGAIYRRAPSGRYALNLVNVILRGKSAAGNGGEICNDTADGSTIAAVIGYSIIADAGGSAVWDAGLGSDAGGDLDADPLLGPLSCLGRLVPTMVLPINSPAIDAGDDDSCPLADARGVTRPKGEHCGLGAFESSDSCFADGFDQDS